MKSRHLLPLSALLTLAAFGLWQLLDPAPARAPARVDPPAAPTRGATAPAPALTTAAPRAAADPADWNLGQAGKPPLHENDPRQGQVWLRLVDDESGRPLVRTRCDLWGVYFQPGGDAAPALEGAIQGYELDETSRRVTPLASRSTDDQGCLKLTATPTGIDPARLTDPVTESLRREGTRKQLSGFDVDFPKGEVGFLYPLPRDCEPVTRFDDLAVRILDLLRVPTLEPLDVRVRRAPVLSGRVTDASGRGLEGALVVAMPLDIAPGLRDWVCFQNGFFQGLHERLESGEPEQAALNEMLEPLLNLRHRSFLDQALPAHRAYREGLGGHTRRESCETRTARDGSYRLPLLCRGLWLVGALRHDSEFGQARLAVEGDQSQDFTLSLAPFGRLVVTVHFEPDIDTLWTEVELHLRRTGPDGGWLALEGDGTSEFDRVCFGGSPAVFAIERIPPGFLAVRAELMDTEDRNESRIVRVSAGETTQLDLHPAADRWGELRPEVYFDGALLPAVEFLASRDASGEVEQHSCRPGNEMDNTCSLRAGSYRVYFQGLAPMPVLIAPGQTTTLRADLPVAAVEFSIDAELFGLLLGDAEGGSYVVLDLIPADGWQNASHLQALDEAMRESRADYDHLAPGRPTAWRVPTGDYVYELWSESGPTIAGPLRLGAGSQTVRLTLDSLPGLGAIRVDLTGFDPEHQPEIHARSFTPRRTPWHQQSGDAMTPRIEYPDRETGPEWFLDETLLWRDRHTLWVVTGRGRRLLLVCDWQEGETGRTQAGAATAPGSLIFKREDSTARGVLQVRIDEDDPCDYEVLAVHHDLPATPIIDGPNDVGTGVWRVFVRRTSWPDDGDDFVLDHAVTEVRVPESGAQLTLANLDYRPGGWLVVQLNGRGPLARGLDSWWQSGESVRFQSPVLQHLDGCLDGHPPALELGRPQHAREYGAAGRTKLQLVYEPIALTPGRYRLLPWFGAPASLAREFEIRPGQTIAVPLGSE